MRAILLCWRVSKMSEIVGPSIGFGFFDTPFKALILGDYHTPVDDSTPEDPRSILHLLRRWSEMPIDVYIEDVKYIGKTTDVEETYAHQRARACVNDTCRPIRIHETGLNGRNNQNTLRGVIEYLFTCGKDDRICPLAPRARVHRIDERAQLIVQKADGRIDLAVLKSHT